MNDFQKTLPEGLTTSIVFDTTQFIEESVREIEFEILLSVLLTAFVCWLFLGSLSSTLNVVLAIPMSLFGTVAIIYFLGFTFNTFTLLAMALAVGIVVDDAIMVMENIFRHRESGKGLVPAALGGTQEIAFAALAATLAVVAIFVPVVFVKGIIGRYFLQFGVTLCLAVLLSYIEAVTLAPARCSQFLRTSREGRSRIGLVVDRGFRRLENLYCPRPGPRPETAGACPRRGRCPLRGRPPRPDLHAGRDGPLPGPQPDVDPRPDPGRRGHHARRRSSWPAGRGDHHPPAGSGPELLLLRHGRGDLGELQSHPGPGQETGSRRQ